MIGGMKMKAIAKKIMNEEKNGIEIYFTVYPLQGTKATLKKSGFRWNPKRGCWYAKKSLNTESVADIMADTTLAEYKEIADKTGEKIKPVNVTEKTSTKKTTAKKANKPETINLENLGVKPEGFRYGGSELSKAIREDLKKRGVKGVSVRVKNYDNVTVTVKATAADFVSVEEAKARHTMHTFANKASLGFYNGTKWIYNFFDLSAEDQETEYNNYIIYNLTHGGSINTHYLLDNRAEFWKYKTAFYKKICAVFMIANQWNYNNSDSMTDYFDVGYYLDIDVKMPEDFEPVDSMTDEEKAAYNAEKAAEEAAEEARDEQFRKEQEEREKAYKAAEKRRKANEKKAGENIIIEDLSENDQFIITNLSGGIGKECNIDEVKESITEHPTSAKEKAVISRKVTYTSEDSFKAFGDCLMSDFDFLAGKGGTGSDDVRLEGVENIWKLNEEQRNSIDWYMVECVAVYVNDELRLVINPEGHNYARYTYIPTEASEVLPYKTESDRIRKESEKKAPFYFPELVVEQAAALHAGQEITIYQTDGWMSNFIEAGKGTVTNIRPGNWAQYKGVYIDLKQGRKTKSVFIRDNKKCLIYEGILPPLPDGVTKKQINDHMYEVLGGDDLFKNLYKYYNSIGITPIIDTWQR
jgi:hypothetical protein